MNHTGICKQLAPILRGVENIADNTIVAKEDNAAGMSLALDAIKGLCELGDRIYRNGGLTQPATNNDEEETQ